MPALATSVVGPPSVPAAMPESAAVNGAIEARGQVTVRRLPPRPRSRTECRPSAGWSAPSPVTRSNCEAVAAVTAIVPVVNEASGPDSTLEAATFPTSDRVSP